MPKFSIIFLFINVYVRFVSLQGVGSGTHGNLRVCVVEGKGAFKRAGRLCPILDRENSGVECVIGTDRLDCLRRMSKETVDFGIFNPEDLIAAQWANLDVLVTNEVRHRPRPFERSIVAVVNRKILPDSVTGVHSTLKNTSLCHPGHGGDDTKGLIGTLSEVEHEFLVSLVTERSCEANLTMTENNMKSLAQFFGKACIAGSWVANREQDLAMKSRYSSLCSLCKARGCIKGDRYWGVSGALMCLSDGAGDVTWAQLKDVIAYFGLSPGTTEYSSPDHFAYLCRDGTWQALRDNSEPCVWLNRPWPAILAKRKSAEAVSQLAQTLTNGSVTVDQHWHGALASILEINQALTDPLSPQKVPLDYLSGARGFREAYSQTGCSPPRHVTLCSTSRLAKHKCDWLSEGAAVYGVNPPLQCVDKDSVEDCFAAVASGEVDMAVADSDWLVKAYRDFAIFPILHETTPIVDQTNTVVAYVKNTSGITKMEDLRGKKAYFPLFDGFAWHAVTKYLSNITNNACNKAIGMFFSEVCAPGIEKLQNIGDKYTKICYKEDGKVLGGEVNALRSLMEGNSDVAFLSMDTVKQISANPNQEKWTKDIKNIVPLCTEKDKTYCLLSWSSLGHIYVSKDVTTLKRHEIVNMFTKMDELFGKNHPFQVPVMAMYAPFNHQNNVLFHDNTRIIATDVIFKLHPYNKNPMNFETMLNQTQCLYMKFEPNFGVVNTPSMFVLVLSLVFYLSR